MSSTSPIERTVLRARSWRDSRWLLYGPIIVLLLLILATIVLFEGQFQIAAAKGIVQGLGEPLPISSSAHLIVTPWLFGWHDPYTTSDSNWALAVEIAATVLCLVTAAVLWRSSRPSASA